jgi:hypothetical protein
MPRAADAATAADLIRPAAARNTTSSNHPQSARSGFNPLCGLESNQTGIYMSEPTKPDPKKKDVRDLTPDKDAKGGRGGHGRDFGAPGRNKHNQL